MIEVPERGCHADFQELQIHQTKAFSGEVCSRFAVENATNQESS
jgi:hypothetical protein